jgi:chromosome segregation ATPase
MAVTIVDRMKSLTSCFAFILTLFFGLSASIGFAQSANASSQTPPSAEQTLQEILRELRQFRSVVQRVSGASHRAQITLDRLRQQQEQVSQLTRELRDVRDQISEVQRRQTVLKTRLDEMEKQVAAGLKAEDEPKMIGGEIEALKQREQALVEREALLSPELEVAKANLRQLNLRLDELEQEIQAASSEGQPAGKRQ